MKTTYTMHPAMSPDFSMASRHEMGLGNAAPESGIDFDGRSYWYRQYRYDRLDDALAYARLDRVDPSPPTEAVGSRRWQGPAAPNATTQRMMAELGIAFDGGYYRYDGYRYDRFADAIDYAQLMRARSAASSKG